MRLYCKRTSIHTHCCQTSLKIILKIYTPYRATICSVEWAFFAKGNHFISVFFFYLKIPNPGEKIFVSAKGVGTAHLYFSYNYNQNVNPDDLCKVSKQGAAALLPPRFVDFGGG